MNGHGAMPPPAVRRRDPVKTIVKMIVVVSALSSLAMAGEVDRRENRQQERIGQGVESGQLTPGETARLERQEQRIDNQIKAERAANGGPPTPAPRRPRDPP